MRDRIIGIENELAAVRVHQENIEQINEDDQIAAQAAMAGFRIPRSGAAPSLEECVKRGHYHLGCYEHSRLWLPNGGCLYVDMQKLEWASPECRRVRDVVIYNKAGERAAITTVRGDNGEPLFDLYKTNVARQRNAAFPEIEEDVSFGAHENYTVFGMPTVGVSTDAYYPLLPFLATRQIYGGSGWWKRGQKKHFWRSQRAAFTYHISGGTTTGSARGLFNDRNEPCATLPGLSRFHLIMGDANMLEYALFLKIGATMLMVSMNEERLLPNWHIRSLEHENLTAPFLGPLNAFQATAKERDLTRQMLTISEDRLSTWQLISPIEMQERYCDMAHAYVRSTYFESEEAESEAHQICAMWNETLSALARKDASFLMGRIDWFTKQQLVQNAIKQQRNKRGGARTWKNIRADIDVLYHELGEGSLYHKLVKKGIAKRVVTDEEISRARAEPPPPTSARGTRASIRGRAIAEALRNNPPKSIRRLVLPIHWDGIEYWREMVSCGSDVRFVLGDPMQYESAALERYLRDPMKKEAEYPPTESPDIWY